MSFTNKCKKCGKTETVYTDDVIFAHQVFWNNGWIIEGDDVLDPDNYHCGRCAERIPNIPLPSVN